MFSDEQLITLAISQSPGIGAKRFWQLYEVLQNLALSLVDFWNLPEKSLAEIEIQSRVLSQFIQHRKAYDFPRIKTQLLSEGVNIVLASDDRYPQLLRQIADRPPVLFVQGELDVSPTAAIAVVGTRRITSYGKSVTQAFVRDLVDYHWDIVSGFMYGVDAVAHTTAIESQGYTVGVIGYGHHFTYPQSHQKLRKQILNQGGALISEYFPDVPPIPGQFPARNRIVAGMSRGVLVTEAAKESGSKITAQCAVEYGRDVFAVPGMITSPFSEGTKDLINSGAKLVTNITDIIEEYHDTGATQSTLLSTKVAWEHLPVLEKSIMELLAVQSMDSDDLARELNISVSELFAILSSLELRGLIEQRMGRYSSKMIRST